MADHFTETSRQGFGSRLANSLAGLVIGPLLVIGAIVLLWWNEGRADEGRIALTAGSGGKVTLYDTETARKFLRLDIGADSEGAGFSPDGKLVAAVDTEGKLHIWSFAGAEDSDVFASVKVYPDELFGQAPEATHLRRLAWLPELSAIAIASSRGEVKIISYDVSAWRKRAQSVFSSK